jgi:septal ring factor EnvC (AmiA/AmiB activator)
VHQQIKSHRELIAETHILALNLEQELNRIDTRIKADQETVSALQDKLRAQERLIRHKEAEMATIDSAKAASAEHVMNRLAAYYQTGEVGIINALFSANDLGDLLNLKEYVQALFQYDQKVLQGFREQIRQLTQAKDALTHARDALKALIDQVKEGEQALLKSREERDVLLARAQAEEKLYRAALKELESAAAKLTKTISQAHALELAAAKRKIPRQAGRSSSPPPGADQEFAARRGHLQPPARGRLIRGFGPYQDPFGSTLMAAGIDLDIPPATLVTAMHAGLVIFSDQMPGYGKLVIIDHGSQYYTLVSGMETLSKKKDEEVRAGDTIGTFGKPSGQINPGLHIEIRHGATPVDPLPWLEKGLIDF